MAEQQPDLAVVDTLLEVLADPKGAWFLQLRDVAKKLQLHADPAAKHAGDCWGAGLGALAKSRLDGAATPAEVEQLQTWAWQLFAQGLEGWYAFMARQSALAAAALPRGNPEEKAFLEAFAGLCAALRRGTTGESEAIAEAARLTKVVDKEARALRAMEAGHDDGRQEG